MILGTRPEAIKLGPVIVALGKDARFRCHVCVTAQHREMLDQALEAFEISPDADLALMRSGQSLADFTARAIHALDEHLGREQPEFLIAQGDTTTVLCASLCSFYRRIPFGHVEAGLRTGNLQAPWPEEANRVLTSRLTTLHFAPTERARQNLLREGVPGESVHVTGNTVVDAILASAASLDKRAVAVPGLDAAILDAAAERPIVLITGHRRESFGPAYESICEAISELAAARPAVQFVYPVHLNPNVQEPVRRILKASRFPNVHLIDPVGYLPFVRLMRASRLILTDSGGIQEEAPSLGKPVLVMRETTERPEGVESGVVRLVGTDRQRIVAETTRLLDDPYAYRQMTAASNPYGDGKAARRIVELCDAYLRAS